MDLPGLKCRSSVELVPSGGGMGGCGLPTCHYSESRAVLSARDSEFMCNPGAKKCVSTLSVEVRFVQKMQG
jgi:hypothetical protein